MRRMSVKHKKIWDWIVLIQKKNEFVNNLCNWLKSCEFETKIDWKTIKTYQTFFFYIYNIYLISAEG